MKKKKKEKEVILSKKEWEAFLSGQQKTLKFFQETDLHHEFGDNPEKYIVRVTISQVIRTVREQNNP